MWEKIINLIQSIPSHLIYIAFNLSIVKDIIILLLGAILPSIFKRISENFEYNRTNSLEKKPIASWSILLVILVLFLFACIYIGHNYTEIPDIIGTDHEYAERQLSAAGLKYTTFYGRPGDVVLSTGDKTYVKKGTIIEVTYGRTNVSDDTTQTDNDMENTVSMPDLYLVSEHNAYMYLLARGFNNIEVLAQYRDDISQGYVTGTEPEAGEIITFEDTITLYVSTNQIE